MSTEATSVSDVADVAAGAAHPGPLAAAGILAGLVVVATGYVFLNLALGITDFWAGFLFLTFWMCMEQIKPGAFTYCAVGAVAGTIMAAALQILPPLYGAAGMAAAYALILGAIYLQIRGKFHLVINFSTMIFLTVSAAVPMQANVKIINVLPALGLGIVFWGGLILGGQKIAALIAARKAAPAAAA